jgi:hypothetical protein
MAIVGVTICQLVVDKLHKLGHAIFGLAQLVFDTLQVYPNMVCGVVLDREHGPFNMDWDRDGFYYGGEVLVWCGCV